MSEKKIFTKNFQRDLQGLLTSGVTGHTLIGAPVRQADPLDLQGRSVLGPDRETIVKPADLGARLPLDHTGQSHGLADQGLQAGRCWLYPRLS